MRIWEENFEAYGAEKAWWQLYREGISCGRDRVARLMRELGIFGVTRQKTKRTTVAKKDQALPEDLVRRNFTAEGPNRLWGQRSHLCRSALIGSTHKVGLLFGIMDVLIRNTARLPGGPSTDRRRRLTALRTGAGRLRRRKTTSTPWCSGSDPGRTAASAGRPWTFSNPARGSRRFGFGDVVTECYGDLLGSQPRPDMCLLGAAARRSNCRRPREGVDNASRPERPYTAPVRAFFHRRVSVDPNQWPNADRGAEVVGVPRIGEYVRLSRRADVLRGNAALTDSEPLSWMRWPSGDHSAGAPPRRRGPLRARDSYGLWAYERGPVVRRAAW